MSAGNNTFNFTSAFDPTQAQIGLFSLTQAIYCAGLIATLIVLKRTQGVRGWTTPRLFCLLLVFVIFGMCFILLRFGALVLICWRFAARMIFFGFYYASDYIILNFWTENDVIMLTFLTNHVASYLVCAADILIVLVWSVRSFTVLEPFWTDFGFYQGSDIFLVPYQQHCKIPTGRADSPALCYHPTRGACVGGHYSGCCFLFAIVAVGSVLAELARILWHLFLRADHPAGDPCADFWNLASLFTA
jgi:hypothetical protein